MTTSDSAKLDSPYLEVPDTSLLYRGSDGSLRYRGMISCRKRRPYLMVGHRVRGARLGEQSDEYDVLL